MLALVAFSEPLVALGFQRGVFSPEDTRLVAQIQRAYLVQIPGALVGMLAMRLLRPKVRVAALSQSTALLLSFFLVSWRGRSPGEWEQWV